MTSIRDWCPDCNETGWACKCRERTNPMPDQARREAADLPAISPSLVARLRGRAAWYRDAYPGAVKTPELLIEAADALTVQTMREE
jgi:hypothetical protein